MSEQRAYPEMAIPVMSEMEFRAEGDGTQFSGYAALFNTPSDAPWLPFVETIRPGAFRASLGAKRDHSLVLNHDDNLLLASTRTGRLTLAEDERGLLVKANLAKTSYASDLKALYDAGEVRGMSFNFKPTRGGVVQSKAGRELTEVMLGHVTAITTLVPGYSATAPTVQMRALAEELAAEPEDLDGLFDALRAGTPLVDDQISLLNRLSAHYAIPEPEPEPETRSRADAYALLVEKIDLAPTQTGAPTGAAN
jgi:HK97 family phage prohead protease